MTQRAKTPITFCARYHRYSLGWFQQRWYLAQKVMEEIENYASVNLLETRFRPVLASGEIEIKQSSVQQIIAEI
jgi:hypothetical protein